MTAQLIGGRYELLSRLGRGGMGTVWLAWDRLLRRRVALKEITLSPSGRESVAVQRERALREARAAVRVRHPSIVPIYDVFEENDTPWIVMAHIEGESLQDRIEAGPLDEREIAGIGRDVLAALTAAHAKRVLHRDVKPANILIGRADKVFLVDFGIAQIDGESGLTSRSLLLGTAEFLAPERVNGLPAYPAADLWSLGVTLFIALEGRSPFGRDTLLATMRAITEEDPPPPRRPGPLFDAIAGLLRKDPDRRMGAAELDRRLTAILTPVRRRSDAPPPCRSSRPPEPAGRRDAAREVRLPPDDLRLSSEDVRLPSEDVRPTPESVRAMDPAEGGRRLLSRPRREAAALLDAAGPRVAGPLLDGMAAARPSQVVEVIALLSNAAAGRMVDHMTAEGAAELFRAMPPGRGAGILAHADERVAAEVLRTLGVVSVTVRLVEAMTLQRACRVLEYVPPALIAALLRESLDGRADRLLDGLSGPVRAEVARLTTRA